MKRFSLPFFIGITAILAAGLVVQASNLSRLKRDLENLRLSVAQWEKNSNTNKTISPPLPNSIGNNSNPLHSQQPVAGAAPRNDDEMGPLPDLTPTLSPAQKEEIDELVQERVAAEIKKRGKTKDEKEKPPLAEVVEKLNVDSTTESRMAEIFNKGKDNAFALLSIPRGDGGTFVNDFVTAFASENPQSESGKVFLRLFSEKIPGTDETYVKQIMELQQSVNKDIKTILTYEQGQTYTHLGLDPLQVKTGYDPWADYFKSKGVTPPGE